MDNKITMDGKYAYRKDPYTQVRILCVDRGGPFVNNIVTVDVDGDVRFYREGSHSYGRDYDLVPLQVKLPDLWVNIYDHGLKSLHESPESARGGRYQGNGIYTEEGVKTIKYIPAPDQTS